MKNFFIEILIILQDQGYKSFLSTIVHVCLAEHIERHKRKCSMQSEWDSEESEVNLVGK